MEVSEQLSLPPEFLARLMASQSALYSYIMTLIGGHDEANDILQETNLKLCRKAAVYDPAQPFMRWAYAFARNEVLVWRTRHARSRLVFDEELLGKIAAVHDAAAESAERKLHVLEGCIEKLLEHQRDFVAARYGRGETVRDIAHRAGMPENALAALFYRVRKALANCVESALRREAVS